MKLKNKKGFTIVELVIVIAVIAILAAVLIPTFTGLINQANVSKDTQLIRNLNTALAADVDGSDNMTDALEAAEEFGYDVEKINASATGNDILWDSANNVFCYYNSETQAIEYIPETSLKVKDVKDYQYWMIADKKPNTQQYSIYASSKFTETAVEVSVGFDAGENKNIDVTYNGTEEVIIRTNGGKLTVNAANSTVNHYGEASELDIQSITAYHEFGRVNSSLEIKEGKLVVERGAIVPAIEIVSNANSANLYIDNLSGNEVIAYAPTQEIENAVKGNTTNVTFTQDGLVITGVAKIENTYYSDITEAFANATTSKIVLLKDIQISTQGNNDTKDNEWLVEVKANQNITLDLLGHEIDYTSTKSGSSGMIKINGNLIIDDTSAAANGAIIYKSLSPDASYRYYTDTILVSGGTLTLNNGTFYNNTVNGASYVVDINGNGTFTMNGGNVYCDNGDQAVRICGNGTFNMHGGEIVSGGLWLQQPGDTSQKAYINIDGGVVNGKIDLCCLNVEDQKVVISGTAVINATSLRIRKYSNSRLNANNSNAAQTEAPFVFVSCASFNVEKIEENIKHFTDIADYAKFVSISGATTLGGFANQMK